MYHKAVPELSYLELERALRTNEIAIYLIATDKRMMDTQTLVNLAGKLDCRYQVGYYFKKTPRSAMMAESWPANDEENHERLKDAGVPIDRGIPKCLRCKGGSPQIPPWSKSLADRSFRDGTYEQILL